VYLPGAGIAQWYSVGLGAGWSGVRIPRSRMREAITPLPNTPSCRGAPLKHRYNFYLFLYLYLRARTRLRALYDCVCGLHHKT
jgi:hypothetical protein